MAIDWDKLQVKVIDDDHIPITDDYKYTMSSEQRMVIFAGRRGEQGPAGPAGPVGPAGPAGGASWGNIDGDIENQTDLADALALKANTADLGDLATQDTVDYQTEVTNKPTLGTMASINDAPSDSKEYVRKNGAWSEATGGIASVSWGDINGTLANQTDLQTALASKADTSDLGDLAYEDDAPSDSKEYVRKNGAWAEATGGISSVAWGDIEGTLSDQTDLQTALDKKAQAIVDLVPVTQSGTYVVVPIGVGLVDFKATYHVTQTGTGTPSASNIRPFESTEMCVIVKADSYGDIALTMETRNISLPSAIYGGIVDVLNGTVIITHGHIASYNGETLTGRWYSDRDVYASGTTPTVGAEVVYELETPIEQTCSSYTPTMFSNRDTYLWASHQSTRLSLTNYTVAGAIDIYEQEIIDTKTYVDQNDALKVNVADLGDLAYEDDAPSDSKEYVRKNGTWSEATGGITSVAWGDVTGTLANQTDLANALNAKQNVLTIDSTPTASSTNPVESGGVKTALDAKQDAFSVLLIEDGGTGQTSLDDIKDAFGLWYKPGDSVGIGSGDASYAGFLALAKRARFIITLDKPVKPGTTVSITGTVAVRVGSSRTDITLSNVAGTVTASGIRVDANAETNMGSLNEPCAVGSVGLTITFS